MSSKWIKRITGAFSFRLNLYYAAFFVSLGLVCGFFVYQGLLAELRDKHRSEVAALSDQLAREYAHGGLPQLLGDLSPANLAKSTVPPDFIRVERDLRARWVRVRARKRPEPARCASNC